MKKTLSASRAALQAAPISTASGVTGEVSTVDALGLGAHQDDNLPGDLAGALATGEAARLGDTDVIVTGIDLGTEVPVAGLTVSEVTEIIDSNAAGDLAASKIGADPLIIANTGEGSTTALTTAVAPLDAGTGVTRPATSPYKEPSGETFSSDTFLPMAEREGWQDDDGDTAITSALSDFTNTTQGDLTGEAGNLASLSDLSDLDLADQFGEKLGLVPQADALREAGVPVAWLIEEKTFSKTHPLTHAAITSHHGAAEPELRVTAKVAGFRRAGFAHPTSATLYPIMSLTPDQVEAILGEPLLVSELI